MTTTHFGTIDEYIASKPDATQRFLETIRACIRLAVPEAQEAISYQIPAFKIADRVFIFFAGWQKHYSLYPIDENLLKTFGPDLNGYKISKGTIRFPLEEPVPEDLIRRLARFKADERAENNSK